MVNLWKYEVAMGGLDYYRRGYNFSDEMTLCKKPAECFYAAPKPHKYGYGVWLTKSARDDYFVRTLASYTQQSKKLVWC